MVIAVNGPYASLKTDWRGEEDARKVFPAWAGVEKLDPPQKRVLAGAPLDDVHAVLATEKGPVAARGRMGKGEVVLLSVPEVFQNAHLAKADHLALLSTLAGGRKAVFDESVHGLSSEAGTVEILRRWGFGPLLVLAALASLVAYWRKRSRLGPEEDDARETRVEAVDFVDYLAMLYDRSLEKRQALGLYARAFEQAVAVRFGLKGAALEARVRDYVKSRPDLKGGGKKDIGAMEFQRGLREINEAFRRLDDAKRPGNRRTDEGARRPA